MHARLNQNALCCVHCGKTYKTRVRLDKHLVLCEIQTNAKQRKRNSCDEDEDDIILPNQKQMYKILVELTIKYNKLEEKMENMSKWVDKKKKKINVVDWLNVNVKPEYTFDLMSQHVIVTNEDFDYMLSNGHFLDVLNEIFCKNIYDKFDSGLPLFGFTQKMNLIYVYEKNEEGVCIWRELTREKLIYFLNIIHFKFVRVMNEWKREHQDKIYDSEHFAEKYNKAHIKVMSVDFKHESTLNRIRSTMYNKIKTDFKSLIEYEFEF
jgi:hypothetical protein